MSNSPLTAAGRSRLPQALSCFFSFLPLPSLKHWVLRGIIWLFQSTLLVIPLVCPAISHVLADSLLGFVITPYFSFCSSGAHALQDLSCVNQFLFNIQSNGFRGDICLCLYHYTQFSPLLFVTLSTSQNFLSTSSNTPLSTSCHTYFLIPFCCPLSTL